MTTFSQPPNHGSFPGPLPPPPPPPPPAQFNTNIPAMDMPRPPTSHSVQPFPNAQSNDEEAIPDSRLSAWVIEKPHGAENWENAKAKAQHLSYEEIQEEIRKFRRKQVSVKDTLNTIRSETARRLPNDVVEQENQVLWRTNPTLQWAIISVEVFKDLIREWPSKQRLKLRRVHFILKTESRPLAEIPGGFGLRGPGHRPIDPNFQPEQSFRGPPEQSFRGPPDRGMPGPPHDNNMPGGPFPLPPLPPGVPPPNMGGNNPHIMQRPMQPPHPNMPKGMPGAFPGAHIVPDKHDKLDKHDKHGKHDKHDKHDKHQQPSVQIVNVLDEKKKKKKKPKTKSIRHETYTVRHDESDSDDSDGSDSGSQLSSESVEDGTYSLISRSRSASRRRDRGRSRSRTIHVERARSQSRREEDLRSRSGTRYDSHDRIVKVFKEKPSRNRGRHSIDRPPMGKYAPSNVSPRSSAGNVPSTQNINIRIDRERASDVGYEQHHQEARRASHSVSPTGFSSPPFKRLDWYAQPMSRNSSGGGSDSSDYIDSNSSVYSTGGSSVFSEPVVVRRNSHSRHPRAIAPAYLPHDRPSPRYHSDNYYHQAVAKIPTAPVWHPPRPPMPPRRHSMQVDHAHPPPRVSYQRSISYADIDPRDVRYVPARAHGFGERAPPYVTHKYADVLPYVDHTRQRRSRGSLGPRDTDEWATRSRYDTRGYPIYGDY